MKTDKINMGINILIGVLAICITLLTISKFFPKTKDEGGLKINGINQIRVVDTTGSAIPFEFLLKKDGSTIFFLYQLSDCYSCVYKGFADLKSLKKEGVACFSVAVSDSIDDVNGYNGSFDFSPAYMLKKKDFYEYFAVAHLPVIIKMKNGAVESYRFITP